MKKIMLFLSAATLLLATLLSVSISTPTQAAPVRELKWQDLVPGNISVKEMEKLMSKAATYQGMDSVSFDPKYFPAVKALNGKRVKIPGYVVPLDFDAKMINEFLLVPYMGACTHSPPPPPNQIVYVKMAKKVAIKTLYDAVLVEGTMIVKTKTSDIANAVYSMKGLSVKPYK